MRIFPNHSICPIYWQWKKHDRRKNRCLKIRMRKVRLWYIFALRKYFRCFAHLTTTSLSSIDDKLWTFRSEIPLWPWNVTTTADATNQVQLQKPPTTFAQTNRHARKQMYPMIYLWFALPNFFHNRPMPTYLCYQECAFAKRKKKETEFHCKQCCCYKSNQKLNRRYFYLLAKKEI